jgi:hypothetical protein
MQSLMRVSTGWLAGVLWLASVAFAIVEIIYVRDLVLRGYAWAVSWADPTRQPYDDAFWGGVTLGNLVVLLAAVVVVVLAVGSGEYHARHVGTRASWLMFVWVFAIEAGIFLLAWLL